MKTIHHKFKKRLVAKQLFVKLFLWLFVGAIPSLSMAQEMTQDAVSNGAGLVSGGNYTGYVSVGQMSTYMYANANYIATSGIILNEINGDVEFTFELSGNLVENENLKSGKLQVKSASTTLEGTPLAHTKVYLLDTLTGDILFETETDENGYFIFPNIPYQNFYFVVKTPEIPLEPVLLTFESNIFIKEVEINGEVGTEGISASVTVTPNNTCDPDNPDYVTWYLDNDGDGFGTNTFSVGQCTQPDGYVLNDSDCDDSDANINPDATDIQGSGVDANCDGTFLWYSDSDEDGFGSMLTTSSSNSSPEAGESYNNLDCDDTDANINPDAEEIPGSGIDANCDGELPCSGVEIMGINAPVNPVKIFEDIIVSANITGSSMTLGIWDWGDGSTSEGNLEDGIVTGSHNYAEPGLYNIKLHVENICNEFAEEIFNYVVIVDPCAGGVKGWGFYMDSPVIGFRSFRSFGYSILFFNQKYNIKKEKVRGNMSFFSSLDGLHFIEKSTDWLVVNNNRAIFKGVGTVNGKGNYNYLVSVVNDPSNSYFAVDYFRIVIWSDDGTVLFDNQPGEEHNAIPVAKLPGNSISITKGCNNFAKKSGIIESGENLNSSNEISLKAYPNPTTGKIILDIQNDKFSDVNVRVMNIAGQKVFEKVYRQNNQIELDLTGNTAGIYLVNVIVGEEYFVKKIILQNR